jgi:hypothetical protein
MKGCGQGKSEVLGLQCVPVQLREPQMSQKTCLRLNTDFRGESPARQTCRRAVLTFVLDFMENDNDLDYGLCIYTLICLYIHISDDHDR